MGGRGRCAFARGPRRVGRGSQALRDALADSSAIDPELTGHRLETLPVKFQNHHEFPEFDHARKIRGMDVNFLWIGVIWKCVHRMPLIFYTNVSPVGVIR